jgi:5'-deoxynucleotidase YfbR-like HD superfamily hydrolase
MKQLLQFIGEGGSVERYHTRPGIKPDTDGRHSHGVAMLCSILAGRDEDGTTKASATLLMAALTHDLAEQWASDVSAGSKRAVPGLAMLLDRQERLKLADWGLDYQSLLSAEEALILRLADQFDCLAYCCRESALGNRNATLIWRRTCVAVEGMTTELADAADVAVRASGVYEALKEIYHETLSPGGPDFDVFKAAP